MIDTTLFNPTIIQISIFALLAVCVVLIGMVVIFAFSFWRLRDKYAAGRFGNSASNNHYLTGLSNRAELVRALEMLVNKSKRNDVNLALMIIDIDDFNNINTALGHKVADALLLHISKTVCAEAKKYTNHVYQIGSDEFAVLLYDYGKDIDPLQTIANDIIHAVALPVNIEGYELFSSCCIGVCVFPECAQDSDALIKHAGSARDNAKKIGYSSYSFYTQEMSKKSVMRALISADLREALQRNEFYLQYQPKVYAATGKVQGAEALLRWRHPSLGNITPDVFIPAIEDLGLIHPIGKWVIHTACQDISKLHAAGFSDLSIAINISPHQFNKGDIASVVAEAIWESGIAPQKVEIELTEAVVMSDTEKSTLMLKVLQSMGIRIAVDDFGTGYSSMNQLTKFPISILKIDKCFIHDLHLHQTNNAIVSTMINMGKQLGFEVVAEGVECKEELELLQKEGCDLIQGFYFSKSLNFADFVKYVEQVNVSGVATETRQRDQTG